MVVEVGTNAGGSAVGIAKGIVENGAGMLICVDNGEGVPRSFPEVARRNILATGLAAADLEMVCEDSLAAIPKIAGRMGGKVDIYLVDAAHTFDAALNDIENGLPMMKSGGLILVHDIDPRLDLGAEADGGHLSPVYEAFMDMVSRHHFEWCILKFIRKHLGIIKARA
jgi:predicted O-methyltransferase YrrM